jgi:hypothetical protein
MFTECSLIVRQGSVYPVPRVSEKRGPLPGLRDSFPGHVLKDDDNKVK